MNEYESLIPQELKTLMRENRVPHAVALESSDKDALNGCAKLLAQWAVCKSNNRPCGECLACLKIKSQNHPDVYTAKLEGKKNAVKISEIRNICADSAMKPNESDCKVYIIPEADKMEAAPQNAFLKLMEEPPQSMIFILLCENTLGLLQTIRSRCSVFKIKGKSDSDSEIIKLAENIAKALCQNKESQLVYACSELNDRQTATKVLARLSEIIRAATAYSITRSLGGEDELVRELSLNVKKRSLVKMQSSISKTAECIRNNVNLSLAGSVLAVNLKYDKYL